MNISITPELEQFVQAKVKSGMYQSASELIREALRLLAERDELQKRRRDAMDRLLQERLDQAARGEFLTPEEAEADIEKLFDELKQDHA